MTQPLHRTQVLLEPQQHKELTRIAASEKRSLSDLLREIVRNELERKKEDDERMRSERQAALEEIRQDRRHAAENREPGSPAFDSVELLHEARIIRAEELWEASLDSRNRG